MDKSTEWALKFAPWKIMEMCNLRPDSWQRDYLRAKRTVSSSWPHVR